MRRCSNCQKEMPDNSRYCASCGQTLIEAEQTMLIRAVRAKSLRPGTRPRPSSLAGPLEGKGEQNRGEKHRPAPPLVGPVSNLPAPGHMPAIHGTPRPGQMPTIADTPTVTHMPAASGMPPGPLPSVAGAPPSTPPPQSFRPVHQSGSVHSTSRVPYGPGSRPVGPVHAQPPRSGAGAQHQAGARTGPTGGSASVPKAAHAGATTSARTGMGATAKILLSILVGMVIVAGGAGAVMLVRQSNSNQPASLVTPQTDDGATLTPTPSPTPVPTNIFTVSGSLTGSMSVASFRACGTLGAGYAIFAIVSLNGRQYNLNILFLNYHGAGAYTNTTASDQINIGLNDSVGGAGTHSWNTSPAHNNGSGIINNDGISGSLTGFTLFSTVDKGKVQLAGNWRCG